MAVKTQMDALKKEQHLNDIKVSDEAIEEMNGYRLLRELLQLDRKFQNFPPGAKALSEKKRKEWLDRVSSRTQTIFYAIIDRLEKTK